MVDVAEHGSAPVRRLQPVILGGDIGAYSLARTFHEAYGVRPVVVSTVSTGLVRHSRILTNVVEPRMDDPEAVVRRLLAIADAHPDARLILMGSADWLVRTIIEQRDRLAGRYSIPYTTRDRLDLVTDKESFGRLCAEHGVTVHFVTAELDGGPLSAKHILGTCFLLLMAGIDTTWSSIGASLWHLATHPHDRDRLVAEPELKQMPAEQVSQRLAGAVFSDIVPGMPLYGRIQGVLVTEVQRSSPAAFAGLRPGDVVVSVNRVAVGDVDGFASAVTGSGSALVLGVRRGNASIFLLVR